MNIQVIYATKTNHSKKLAEAIASELKVEAVNIAQAQPDSADLLFIVGGIYGGESAPALLEYVKQLEFAKIKKVALVTGCASGTQKQLSVRKILKEKGIKVVDEFVCKCGFLFVAAKHPDKADLMDAAAFARKLADEA